MPGQVAAAQIAEGSEFANSIVIVRVAITHGWRSRGRRPYPSALASVGSAADGGRGVGVGAAEDAKGIQRAGRIVSVHLFSAL